MAAANVNDGARQRQQHVAHAAEAREGRSQGAAEPGSSGAGEVSCPKAAEMLKVCVYQLDTHSPRTVRRKAMGKMVVTITKKRMLSAWQTSRPYQAQRT